MESVPTRESALDNDWLSSLKYLVPIETYVDNASHEVSEAHYTFPDCVTGKGAASEVSELAAAALRAANVQCALNEKVASMTIWTQRLESRLCVVRVGEVRRVDVALELATRTAEEIAELLQQIVLEDLDECHFEVLHSVPQLNSLDNWRVVTEKMLGLLAPEAVALNHDVFNFRLKQQRVVVILADLLWLLKELAMPLIDANEVSRIAGFISARPQTRERICSIIKDAEKIDYFVFLEPFLAACNEKELEDFEICAQVEASSFAQPSVTPKFQGDCSGYFVSESGMRIGISSANASDNWTSAKLRGGFVMNVSVNLNGVSPLRAKVQKLSSHTNLVLESCDSLLGKFLTTSVTFSDQNAGELLNYLDPTDHLRMLKYALIFVGIIDSSPASSKEIMSQLHNFTGGTGLLFSLTNRGPSRSGFASSSAVSANILKTLYAAMGRKDVLDDPIQLGSLVLLFENRLGLKSGRQDVDGLLPHGLKILKYPPTESFLKPQVHCLEDFDCIDLPRFLMVVDSGIQRSASLGLRRGLNMRHWVFLSRAPDRFTALLKSYGIHDEIVEAMKQKNAATLGKLFLMYMGFREKIDPGATWSIFDEAMGCRVLKWIFETLEKDELIHGGMYTGAMGGGVAMLILAPKANELVNGTTKIDLALANITALQPKDDESVRPFKNLSKIDYDVNVNGICCGWEGSEVSMETSVAGAS